MTTISITRLKRISTPGGDVLHAFKCNDTGFHGFGEVYLSLINYGAIKAWKRHTRMTMNLVVPSGNVRFVFRNSNSEFITHDIGDLNYCRISIPPGIWFGFKGLSSPQSIVMNIADLPHDPSEVDRLPISEIPYSW